MKFRIVPVVFALFAAPSLFAQWVACTSGSVTCTTQRVGINTTDPQDRLHIVGTAPNGITIETGGTSKGRITAVVPNWIGFTVNATFNGSGWVLDDASRDGWFMKLDDRPGWNKFSVWRIPAGAGVHNNESELLSLDATGKLVATNVAAKYQDVAEWVSASEALSAGTVVVVDPAKRNGVTMSRAPYDTTVAGVVSENPGVILGVESASKAAVATTGRVKVRVDATKSPIRAGDLLVTSDKPGMAMRSEPVDVGGVKLHRPGTLVGKALEPLASGEGEILVLLSLQ